MGLLDSIKSGYQSVSNSVSSTVDSVENKVSSAVDTVENKLSSAVDSVEQTAKSVETKAVDFAKSEFKQATDYAKATGQKLEHAAEKVYDTAKSIPLGNPLTAGKKLLEKLEGKSSDAPSVQGEGGPTSKPNGGDPNEKVDLGNPDKIKDFLSTYGQRDKTDSTNSDGARCQSNVMVAGLLLKGGVPELQKGLQTARDDAQKQLDGGATGGKKIALQNAIKEYDEALGGLKSGSPTRGQLDKAADALFHTMAQPSVYNDKGEPTADGIGEKQISEMENKLGLGGGEAHDVGEYKWYNPAQLWTDNNEEVANKVFESIPNGGSAHVGVNLYGEALAKQAGPNGEKIQKSDRGELYYIPGDKPDQVTNREYIYRADGKERGINHAVLFGKSADGSRFIYNPNGDPPMISEKSAGKKQFEAMAADLIARQKAGTVTDDYKARVTNY